MHSYKSKVELSIISEVVVKHLSNVTLDGSIIFGTATSTPPHSWGTYSSWQFSDIQYYEIVQSGLKTALLSLLEQFIENREKTQPYYTLHAILDFKSSKPTINWVTKDIAESKRNSLINR